MHSQDATVQFDLPQVVLLPRLKPSVQVCASFVYAYPMVTFTKLTVTELRRNPAGVKGFWPMLAVGVLLVLLFTACGSSDTDTGEESGSDDDATLTTGDAPPQSDEANTSSQSDGENTSDDGEGALDDAVSATPDDLAGSGLSVPTEDQAAPPRDSLLPVTVLNVAYRVMEIDPPQVILEVSGEVSNPCQSVWSEWEVDEDGTTYDVTVWGVAPTADDDASDCPEGATPFTADVFLQGPGEFGGFPPGEYTVVVNDTFMEAIST